MISAISLAEAMHIPIITPNPIDEFQQRSYLISVAYRIGFKIKTFCCGKMYCIAVIRGKLG